MDIIGGQLPTSVRRQRTDTLVLDNASFHKRADTESMITGAGHILEYLPPYSPDLNRIEPACAIAKATRRKTGESVDDLFKRQKWNQN